jgi:FAD/FMN-containing dehydrogenase
VYVMGTDSLDSIMKIYEQFKKVLSPVAYEMFTDLALKYVCSHGGGKQPLSTETKYYVLMEIENTDPTVADVAASVLEKLFEDGLVSDAAISQNSQQAQDFWRLRENITEATSHKKPYKNDISVRVAKVPEFLNQMDAVIRKEHPDFEVVWFGHVGDGNLHVNILKPDNLESPQFVAKCKAVDQKMFQMIQDLGGSISAEHGVGLVKKPFVHFTRSEAEMDMMRGIKSVFDPDGIMNPGKLFD